MPFHIHAIHMGGFIWTALVLIALALVGSKLIEYQREKQLQEITYLRSYYERLRIVVAEMLAQVNDIDQASAYTKLGSQKSKRLGTICEELVGLSESLPLLAVLIEGNNRRSGRNHLLKSCRMAEQISSELKQLNLVGIKERPAITGDSSSSQK